MAIRFNTGFVEVITSKIMPLLHTVEYLGSIMICTRCKPSRIGFEEVEDVMIKFPEVVSKSWILLQENWSTHRLNCRTNEQPLDKAIQILVFSPIAAKMELVNLLRDQGRKAISHALQAGAVEEAKDSFSIIVVITIFFSNMTVRMGFWVDARIVLTVNLHGPVWGQKKLFQREHGHVFRVEVLRPPQSRDISGSSHKVDSRCKKL